MDKLYGACDRLLELKSLTGKNAKAAYIQTHKDDKEFITLLQYLLDVKYNYKFKKLSGVKYVLEEKATLTFDEYTKLLDTLSLMNISDKLRKHTENTLSTSNYRYANVLEGIIRKDFSVGIKTSLNKILGYNAVSEFSCMLASPMTDVKDIEKVLPCYVDIKYDGVRCLAYVFGKSVTLYTRQGKVMNFPQIEKELLKLANGSDLVFDGEIISSSRTSVSGIVNSNLKTGYKDGSDNFLTYKVFDVIPYHVFTTQSDTSSFSKRRLALDSLFVLQDIVRVQPSEGQLVATIEKVLEIAKQYIKDGEEGIIIKDMDAKYFYKRNKAWLKVKAINSTTLECIGTELGTGKNTGKVSSLRLSTSCRGLEVSVHSGLTDELIDLFTAKNPTGLFIEVIFNVMIQARNSDTFSLFLPRYKEVRVDKTEADSLEKIKAEHIGAIQYKE